MVVNVGIRYDYFDSQFWVLNDPEDPNYLSPLKPINKWEDIDGDGQISDEEMKYSNLKSDSDRLSSNANGEPGLKRQIPRLKLAQGSPLPSQLLIKDIYIFLMVTFFRIQVSVTSMTIQSLKYPQHLGLIRRWEC